MGKRGINEKFFIGDRKAFPEYRLDELFHYSNGGIPSAEVVATASREYHHARR